MLNHRGFLCSFTYFMFLFAAITLLFWDQLVGGLTLCSLRHTIQAGNRCLSLQLHTAGIPHRYVMVYDHNTTAIHDVSAPAVFFWSVSFIKFSISTVLVFAKSLVKYHSCSCNFNDRKMYAMHTRLSFFFLISRLACEKWVLTSCRISQLRFCKKIHHMHTGKQTRAVPTMLQREKQEGCGLDAWLMHRAGSARIKFLGSPSIRRPVTSPKQFHLLKKTNQSRPDGASTSCPRAGITNNNFRYFDAIGRRY